MGSQDSRCSAPSGTDAPVPMQRTAAALERLMAVLDYQSLGEIYCDDGGAAFWQDRREAVVELGLAWAAQLGERLGEGGTSLYVGAGVAELPPLEELDVGFLGLTKQDYFSIAEILVLAIVAILVVLLVLRPIVSRALASARPLAVAGAPGELEPGMRIGADGQPVPIGGPEEGAPEGRIEDEVDDLIDMAQVEGRVRASSLARIGEIIDSHPDETLAILRNWLYAE